MKISLIYKRKISHHLKLKIMTDKVRQPVKVLVERNERSL
jgi:hypothetical protein